MNNQDIDFDFIEPYIDSQVSDVIQSLLKDKDFHKAISSHFYPKLNNIAPFLTQFIFQKTFSRHFRSSSTIDEFQQSLAPFVKEMIDKTTKGFTYSGLENLTSKPTLFLSNHRDIALDSLFLNYARFREGFKTARIAVGDNLLDGGFSEKLMRLNKSFVVHRNIKGVKKTFRKLKRLSSFIDRSINTDKESIWISQKEGRASDGNDYTDTAVLKMLYLSCRKKLQLDQWILRVNLTPISISYEYDPLDVTKAIGWEGWEGLSEEENNKRDLEELMKGIREEKGRVHLHICKSLSDCPSKVEELAFQIDNEIISNYRLWPSNFIAAKETNLFKTSTNSDSEVHDALFLKRFEGLEPELKEKVLKIYAAPYVNARKKSS